MRDRIVELAAVRWQDGREAGAFQALVHPGRPIPHDAIRIHGITDAMVAGSPPVSAVLPAFLQFCRADMLVAHNARFDLSFLREACIRDGLPMLDIPIFDTCALARQLLPTARGYSLEAVKGVLGIGRGQSHRALDDARDCLAVFLRFIAMGYTPVKPRRPLSHGEQVLLRDLLAAMQARRRIRLAYRDGRGRLTTRDVLPLSWTEDDLVLEAHCYLRDEVRHFHLGRIQQAWTVDEGEEASGQQ